MGLVVPEHGLSPAVLLQRADVAMYAAKQAGRKNVATFRPDMDETARTRSELAMDLRHAVSNRELSLAYQQQNDTETEEVGGFEALLRWSHSKHGKYPPRGSSRSPRKTDGIDRGVDPAQSVPRGRLLAQAAARRRQRRPSQLSSTDFLLWCIQSCLRRD